MGVFRSVVSVFFLFVFINFSALAAKPDKAGTGGGKKDTSDSTEICDQYGNLKGWAKKNYSPEDCVVAEPEPQPQPNTVPEVSIISPVGGTYELNQSLELLGSATDAEDGDLSSVMVWRSSLDGYVSSPAMLSEGEHLISLSVTDSGGLTATTEVVIIIEAPVNTAPIVVITSPLTGTSVEEGDSFVFEAVATDNQDGDLSMNVQWSSSVDGQIAQATALSVGEHVITAKVVDSEGLSAEDSIYVSVLQVAVPEPEPEPNTMPVVSIISPVGGTYELNQPLALLGSATDTEDGDLSSVMVWRSSIDGYISSPALLSEGEHLVSLSVSDSGGLTSTAEVLVVIEAPIINTAPTVSITSPLTGASVEEGYSFLFEAVATDNEEGDLSMNVLWSSSLDGQIADLTTLSVGDHVITAGVVDSEGLYAEDSIYVSVLQQTAMTKSVEISWDTPLYRYDGSPLPVDEIGGYEITLEGRASGEVIVIDVPDGYSNNLVTEPLLADEYALTMKTYDVKGTYSVATEPFLIVVDGN